MIHDTYYIATYICTVTVCTACFCLYLLCTAYCDHIASTGPSNNTININSIYDLSSKTTHQFIEILAIVAAIVLRC